ncbi:M56 family peptidase [Dysgonomonas sp. 216]|uniref:M56 family metallopeptidase n=1 Tax=Dysgonomonas sp. 216 TaxID=2302934 RepID=UPI0013D4E14D|nr:M56 family metallopeptidase [Dysgonomonas sp. 216]NDW18010.1 M56 family peptidase [Dysgonomonas sp. 216]
METTIILYVLKVNMAIMLVYGFYYIFLRKDTFFNLKRAYFLGGITISLVYPFVIFDLPSSYSPSEIVQALVYQITLSPVEVVHNQQASQLFGVRQIISMVLLLVSVVLLIRLIIQCLSIIYLVIKYNNRRQIISEVEFFDLNDREIAPFSFFKWIFINKEKHEPTELEEIVLHEKVHARQYHSMDVLICEMLCVLFWWNPMVWMLRKDLRLNLEYVVDNNILLNGIDAKQYQYHLVKLSFGKNTAVVNNFNVSQLKKRITMMNKERTIRSGVAKYIFVFPAVFLLITANCIFTACGGSDTTSMIEEQAVVKVTGGESKEGAESPVLPEIEATAKGETEADAEKQPLTAVEKMPEFKGGQKELMMYIGNNLKYPEDAIKRNIEGRVIVRFVVTATGKVTDVKVVRSLDEACDAEAIRVVKAMPDWTPGMQDGKAVPVFFTLPIAYKLQHK